jgi:hypothetical protein
VFMRHRATNARALLTGFPVDTSGCAQALDRASEGLPFSKAQRVALDLRAASAALRLGGSHTPLAAAAACSASGAVVMARLATLPPLTDALHVPVTAWHSCAIAVPRRGCRPPPKAYTDVSVKLSGLVVGASAGLEPAVAALSKAARRITPPSAVTGDGREVPVDTATPRLPRWDRLRYQWRGRGRLVLSDAALVLSRSHAPAASVHHTRAVLKARQLEIDSQPDATLLVHAADVAADAIMPQHEGRSPPAAPGLRVPLLALPSVRLVLSLGVELPGGRHPGSHHVFPPLPVSTGAPGVDDVSEAESPAQQGPVDVAAAMTAEGFTLALSANVRSVTGEVRLLCCSACSCAPAAKTSCNLLPFCVHPFSTQAARAFGAMFSAL